MLYSATRRWKTPNDLIPVEISSVSRHAAINFGGVSACSDPPISRPLLPPARICELRSLYFLQQLHTIICRADEAFHPAGSPASSPPIGSRFFQDSDHGQGENTHDVPGQIDHFKSNHINCMTRRRGLCSNLKMPPAPELDTTPSSACSNMSNLF